MQSHFHTTSVDLTRYPIPNQTLSVEDGVQITMPSMHANALCHLWTLCFYGILELKNGSLDYEKFCNLYHTPIKLWSKEMINELKNIINDAKCEASRRMSGPSLKKHAKSVYLRYLDGEVANNGQLDLINFYIFKKLQKEKISFTCLASKNTLALIGCYELGLSFAITDAKVKSGDSRKTSSENMQVLIDKKIIERNEVERLIKKYYLPHLKLIDYSISHDSIFTYYSNNLLNIKDLATQFNVPFQISTVKDKVMMCESIIRAFDEIKKYNVIHKIYVEDSSLLYELMANKKIKNKDLENLTEIKYIIGCKLSVPKSAKNKIFILHTKLGQSVYDFSDKFSIFYTCENHNLLLEDLTDEEKLEHIKYNDELFYENNSVKNPISWESYWIVKLAVLTQISGLLNNVDRKKLMNHWASILAKLEFDYGVGFIVLIKSTMLDLRDKHINILFKYLFNADNAIYFEQIIMLVSYFPQEIKNMPMSSFEGLLDIIIRFNLKNCDKKAIRILIAAEKNNVISHLAHFEDPDLVELIFNNANLMKFLALLIASTKEMNVTVSHDILVKIMDDIVSIIDQTSTDVTRNVMLFLNKLKKDKYDILNIAYIFDILAEFFSELDDNFKRSWFFNFLSSKKMFELLDKSKFYELLFDRLLPAYFAQSLIENNKKLQACKKSFLETLNSLFQLDLHFDQLLHLASPVKELQMLQQEITMYTYKWMMMGRWFFSNSQVDYFIKKEKKLNDFQQKTQKAIINIKNKIEKLSSITFAFQDGQTDDEKNINLLSLLEDNKQEYPDLNYTWIGRPNPKVPGQDIIGPVAMAKLNNKNNIYFWCLATFKHHYEDLFASAGLDKIKVKTVESLIFKAIDDKDWRLASLGGKFKQLYNKLLSGLPIETVPVRDLIVIKNFFYFLHLACSGGYLFDTNILPTDNTASYVLAPSQNKVYAPYLGQPENDNELSRFSSLEGWAHYAPQNQFNEVGAKIFRTAFAIWQGYYDDYMNSNRDKKSLKKYYEVTGNTAVLPLVFPYVHNEIGVWIADDLVDTRGIAIISEFIQKTYANTHKFYTKNIFDKNKSLAAKQAGLDQIFDCINFNNTTMLKNVIALCNANLIAFDVNQRSNSRTNYGDGNCVYEGDSILDFAIRSNRLECVTIILQAINLNLTDNERRETERIIFGAQVQRVSMVPGTLFYLSPVNDSEIMMNANESIKRHLGD